jgi:hypothetical protein
VGDVLDAGARVGLVAEEVLEDGEAGDGVEVLKGGEGRELEDVAADEGCGGDDEASKLVAPQSGQCCTN